MENSRLSQKLQIDWLFHLHIYNESLMIHSIVFKCQGNDVPLIWSSVFAVAEGWLLLDIEWFVWFLFLSKWTIYTSDVPHCMDFSYHMYGSNTGTLSIYLKHTDTGNLTSLWSVTGDQGNKWHDEVLVLTTVNFETQVSDPKGGTKAYCLEGYNVYSRYMI